MYNCNVNVTVKRNRLACPAVNNIVKVRCYRRLVDKFDDIGLSDDTIELSSDNTYDKNSTGCATQVVSNVLFLELVNFILTF